LRGALEVEGALRMREPGIKALTAETISINSCPSFEGKLSPPFYTTLHISLLTLTNIVLV
jgi:hypothetical protein